MCEYPWVPNSAKDGCEDSRLETVTNQHENCNLQTMDKGCYKCMDKHVLYWTPRAGIDVSP